MGEIVDRPLVPPPSPAAGQAAAAGPLPDGVRLLPLAGHPDHRGKLTEIFRTAWVANGAGAFVQWNATTSDPRVLRGVHVHARHTDYLVLLAGEVLVGLHDMRPGSPSAGVSRLLTLSGSAWHGLVVPPGVAHGFLFLARSLLLFGFDRYWDPADDIGCHWAAPELGFDWPIAAPVLSERDATAGDYASLKADLAAALAEAQADRERRLR